MKFQLTLSRKGMLVIAIPCLIQLTFFGINGKLLEQTEQLALKEYHNKEVIGHTNWLATLMSVGTLGCLSYALTGDKDYNQAYKWCTAAIPGELNALAQIATNSEIQEKQIRQITNSWQHWQTFLNNAAAGSGNGATLNHLYASAGQDNPKAVWWALFNARRQLLASERSEFAVGPASVQSARSHLSLMVSVGVVLNILIAFALFQFFNKGITERLGVLAENSVLLAQSKEIHPPLKGSDEIVQLDRTFHEMAEALTKAHDDLKASEQRVLTMIEKMPIGLVAVNKEGVIEFANPTIRQMFARDEGSMNGVSLDNYLAPAKFFETEQVAKGRPLELPVTRSNGEPFTIELSLTHLSMKDGEKTLVVMQDVTERHEVERLKQEFVSMVSHDLRTPLNSIRLFHQLLAYTASEILPAPLKQNLEAADRSTTRLLNLVNDLLDIGKLEAGKLKMQFTKTAVSSLIEQSVEAVKNFADEHEIKISYPQTTLKIAADEERLIQVVVNLLSNAVKFSAKRTTVTISIEKIGGLLEVRVQDQGRGIPASDKELIFEQYKQVQAVDGTRKKGGTGLGLPICKAIIEEHGGTIGLESELGKGSCFWFRIPIEQSAAKLRVG